MEVKGITMSKICPICKINKEFAEYHKKGKTGYQSICKSCKSELGKKRLDYNKEYYMSNKDKILHKNKIRYENNKDVILQKCRSYYNLHKSQHYIASQRWYLNNKDRWNELARIRAHNNPEKIYAHTVLMRLKRKNRFPLWANKIKIQEIYKDCKNISQLTGIQHEVDHIIPLCGKYVSGLHVENNLRIIPKTENRLKSNKFYFNGDI